MPSARVEYLLLRSHFTWPRVPPPPFSCILFAATLLSPSVYPLACTASPHPLHCAPGTPACNSAPLLATAALLPCNRAVPLDGVQRGIHICGRLRRQGDGWEGHEMAGGGIGRVHLGSMCMDARAHAQVPLALLAPHARCVEEKVSSMCSSTRIISARGGAEGGKARGRLKEARGGRARDRGRSGSPSGAAGRSCREACVTAQHAPDSSSRPSLF